MNECTTLPLLRHSNFSEKAKPLIQKNWHVFPLHSIVNGSCSCRRDNCHSPGKHPLTKNGFHDATTSMEVISEWGKAYPFANIGVATGFSSGIVVLDIDVKSGGQESLATLPSLAGHREVRSGGGGIHYYFLAPSDRVPCRVGLLPGIDFRGDGGYIVAPPSKHLSGNEYSWVSHDPLQILPQWLMDRLQQRLETSSKNELAGISEGKRNTTLASIAGFLRTKGLDDGQVSSVLSTINEKACVPPLPDNEVRAICQSINRYDAWEPIRPLKNGSQQPIPMEPQHLPELIREWVVDVCERMQLPLEFVAVPAIVSVGSVIGRKVAICPVRNDDWTVIPNLWGLLIADPGSMKSAALNQAFAPLKSLEKKARIEFQRQSQEQAQREKSLALEIECLKQSIKLDWSQGMGQMVQQKKDHLRTLNESEKQSIKEKRYVTNDPTIEKLALIMRDNPQGILLVRDELSGWLESLSKSGREGSREFYLEAWNGNGSFSIDRIGRGSTFTDSLCLSVFGGIQPERLKRYMERYEVSHGDDGFLERFQLSVFPAPRTRWDLIERKPNVAAMEKIRLIFETLDSIPIDESSPLIARFSEASQKTANEYRTDLEGRLVSPDLSDIEKSYLSKYRSLMPSLALIFQIIQDMAVTGSVSQSATDLAIEWCNILESNLKKILALWNTSESAAMTLLKKIQNGELVDRQTVREIYRKSWRGLNTPQKVGDALGILARHGYVRLKKESGLGGTSEVIFINPNLGGLS